MSPEDSDTLLLRLRDRGGRFLLQILGPLVGLALVSSIFIAWKPSVFLNRAAFDNVVKGNYHVVVAAVGATFVIVTGGIDLSVGSTMALASVFTVLALKGYTFPAYDGQQATALTVGLAMLTFLATAGRALQAGDPYGRSLLKALAASAIVSVPFMLAWYLLAGRSIAPQPAVLAALAGVLVGGVVGFVNGTLVTAVSLPPFIVTLATYGAVRGAALYISGDKPIQDVPEHIARSFSDLHYDSSFLLGLPPNVWIAWLVVVLGIPLLHFTVLGRYVYAIGSNERTARLCGVRVERWKTAAYVIAGLAAGLAGVMMTAKANTSGQSTQFMGEELQVIAAVVIGGTSLFGGEGTIVGSYLGAVILSVLSNGCSTALIPASVQKVFIGGTIVLAAALDRFRHLRR